MAADGCDAVRRESRTLLAGRWSASLENAERGAGEHLEARSEHTRGLTLLTAQQFIVRFSWAHEDDAGGQGARQGGQIRQPQYKTSRPVAMFLPSRAVSAVVCDKALALQRLCAQLWFAPHDSARSKTHMLQALSTASSWPVALLCIVLCIRTTHISSTPQQRRQHEHSFPHCTALRHRHARHASSICSSRSALHRDLELHRGCTGMSSSTLDLRFARTLPDLTQAMDCPLHDVLAAGGSKSLFGCSSHAVALRVLLCVNLQPVRGMHDCAVFSTPAACTPHVCACHPTH